MVKSSGVGARIARELEEVRVEIANKNHIKKIDADKEISKLIKGMKGKIVKREDIVF